MFKINISIHCYRRQTDILHTYVVQIKNKKKQKYQNKYICIKIKIK